MRVVLAPAESGPSRESIWTHRALLRHLARGGSRCAGAPPPAPSTPTPSPSTPSSGAHFNVHELRWREQDILLINDARERYLSLRPADHQSLRPEDFGPAPSTPGDAGSVRPISESERQRAAAAATKAPSAGLSCDDVCASVGKKCTPGLFPALNDCQLLASHFPCTDRCEVNYGPDQPVYVPDEHLVGSDARQAT